MAAGSTGLVPLCRSRIIVDWSNSAGREKKQSPTQLDAAINIHAVFRFSSLRNWPAELSNNAEIVSMLRTVDQPKSDGIRLIDSMNHFASIDLVVRILFLSFREAITRCCRQPINPVVIRQIKPSKCKEATTMAGNPPQILHSKHTHAIEALQPAPPRRIIPLTNILAFPNRLSFARSSQANEGVNNHGSRDPPRILHSKHTHAIEALQPAPP
jgi:hypothetical protein